MIRLTKDLNGLNLSMDRLLSNSNTLHQHLVESRIIPDIGNARSLASLLQQVRDRADRLFQAFHEAWTLDCHPSHEAMLFLDTPASLKGDCHSLNSNRSAFKFRLVLRGEPAGQSGGLSWHETYVTVFEGDAKASKPAWVVSPSSAVMALTESIKQLEGLVQRAHKCP